MHIAALLLGIFKRYRCALHQCIPIHAVARKYRNADAASHEQIVPAYMKHLGHRFQKPRRHGNDALRLVDLHQQHGKLIAAQTRQTRQLASATHARDGVAASNTQFQPFGDGLQKFVAQRGSQRLIDLAEVVNIDMQ